MCCLTKMNWFILLSLLVFYQVDATDNLTNIEFIGKGYDIIVGNPHTDEPDMGFRQPVIKLTHNTNKVSPDNLWFIPDNIDVTHQVICTFDTATSVIHGMTSYVNSLSTEVTFGVYKLNAFRFTGSTTYQSTKSGIYNSEFTYLESVTKCFNYTAEVEVFNSIVVTDNFQTAVKNLPASNSPADKQHYIEFIKQFGTHYISKVEMGSKVVIQRKFDKNSWKTINADSINVNLAAAASFAKYVGSIDSNTITSIEDVKEFECLESSEKYIYIGRKPPSDGNIKTWVQLTGEYPYPLQYTLVPLSTLFTGTYITNINTLEIQLKGTYLDDVVANTYCAYVNGCGTPPADPPEDSSNLPPGYKSKCPHAGVSNSSTRFIPVQLMWLVLMSITYIISM